MSTTWPYKPNLFVAGTRPAASDMNLLSRAILGMLGVPLAGDQARPYAVLRQSVAQSIANSTSTAVLFDAEDLDTLNAHSTTSNTSRWTCPAGCSGWYPIDAQAVFASNATGKRQAFFWVNRTTAYGGASHNAVSGDLTALSIATVLPLNAGDYVELGVVQASGGSLNTLVASGWNCRMTVRQELAS